MEKLCAVYHWWDEGGDSPAYANLRAPILISIATLRAVNPDIPIVVLDIEDKEREWAHFPEKLNFTIKKIKPNLADCSHLIRGWKYLSRIYDVHLNVPAEYIMYVDADCFFLQDPLPLHTAPDKFCFDGWNTGFYHYNRHSENNHEFLRHFIAYTRAAIYSEDIRSLIREFAGYHSWHGVWDEMICAFMVAKHPQFFDAIPYKDHATAKLMNETGDPDVRMFHCNGTMVSNIIPKTPNEKEHCRGLLGILAKEFYDLLCSVLDSSDLRMIYSAREMSYYMPQQFELRNMVWERIKSEDGHFHIEKQLNPRSKMII